MHLVCHFNLQGKNDDFLIRDTVTVLLKHEIMKQKWKSRMKEKKKTPPHSASSQHRRMLRFDGTLDGSISVSDNQMNEVRLSMNRFELEQVTATLFSHLIFRSLRARCCCNFYYRNVAMVR